MSGIIWTLETLKTIEQLDYLWKVIENSSEDELNAVYFGTKGEGYAPNYLIKYVNGTKKAFKGLSHKEDSIDEYNSNNLSEEAFSLSDLKLVFDQQSKSSYSAVKLMSEYWKENKNLFLLTKPVSEYRDKIIALSTSGVPIDKAFKLIISTHTTE
ncbi:hypothetical protein ACVBIO_15885 [Shewanella sp. 0m-8]